MARRMAAARAAKDRLRMDGEAPVYPADALPDLSKLSGDLRMLAEIPGVGVAMALRIAQIFGGTPIRIYGVQKWLRRHRDRCIRRSSILPL